MRIAILTNEYPPHVYGGAGVHVEYLTRELARIDDLAHRAAPAWKDGPPSGAKRLVRVGQRDCGYDRDRPATKD